MNMIKKDKQVAIRLPSELYQKIKNYAESSGLSFSAYTVFLLSQKAKRIPNGMQDSKKNFKSKKGENNESR